MTLLRWVIQYRFNLVPERIFDLRSHPFLVGIYDDPAESVLIMKAAQMGASEYAISFVLWAADIHQATALYVFPTDRHVSDFSSARLGPAIEASRHLQQIVLPASGDGKRGADRVQLKRVANRFLYLRGGQVSPDGRAPQLKSVDADVLVLDELDEMPAKARPIALKRLGHSHLKWQRELSTPSYEHIGIDEQFRQTDQRYWFLTCTACGHKQDITINDVVLEWDALGRPVQWHGKADGRAYAGCRHCGSEVPRLAEGEWVAKHPGRERHGYHLTGLISAQKSLDSIVANLNEVDETKRKECFNQDLGLTFTPAGGKLTSTVLDACRRDYAMVPSVGGAFAGVDVGKVLNVVIRGQQDLETGERPARWIGTVDEFEDLGTLFKLHGVSRAVIDALPETRKAAEFQRAHVGIVWLAYYSDSGKRATAIDWREDPDGDTVHMDRTRTLDETFSRFVLQSSTLPANARDLQEYYAQMCAPVRVLEKKRDGNQVARWVETAADHYAHAENYCAAAFLAPAPAMPISHVVTREQVHDLFD